MLRSRAHPIPVTDVFAGPGGLAEGFGRLRDARGRAVFDVALSIEKDAVAHRTLLLRSFVRRFPDGGLPDAYYARLRGELSSDELFGLFPEQAGAARAEAWRAALGDPNEAPLDLLRETVRKSLSRYADGLDRWVLIGGPPCQAYSLMGRSRNRGIAGYRMEDDPRARLYLEYLQLIGDFWPAVFVMENVRGLLSAKFDGQPVIDRILTDLQNPADALRRHGRQPQDRRKRKRYVLRPLTRSGLFESGSDFLLRCERHGIPQARHRVIMIGIREDIDRALSALDVSYGPSVDEAICDLPRIRSRLSKEPDSFTSWRKALAETKGYHLPSDIRSEMRDVLSRDYEPLPESRGHEFVGGSPCIRFHRVDWFVDERLRGFCHHAARSHIRKDLHRYLFATVFAKLHGRSPGLDEFPGGLLPNHQNAMEAPGGFHFADRFRVQCRDRFATTITSHISRDGHYYIHPDPAQCRSLTVREAARLQTFPDNYFFEGPRTAQYTQVGNAVPPLLARQIASIIAELL